MPKSNTYFICLDDPRHHVLRHYDDFHSLQSFLASEMNSIDDALQAGWEKQLHAVIFADYDFGLPILQLPQHPLQNDDQASQFSIYWFKQLKIANNEKECQQHFSKLYQNNLPSGLTHLQFDTSKEQYIEDIHAIQSAIGRGEVYQINYTTRLHFNAYGNPINLYLKLREQQQVPYGVLAHLPRAHQTNFWHLGFSPELFLDIQANGEIRTEPMKGTAPILEDGFDEQRALELKNDPKNRAENIMIVDLLRNDLGKIASIGGVSVPEPFSVNAFGSVWQMTTEIIAKMQPNTTIHDILQAAFPCGSITGAPKRFAMHLINQLEKIPRGLYTGSVGYIEPCETGLGFQGKLNVVIRSLELTEQSPHYFQGKMGVGSGIVIDSDAELEYEECGWKSQFLKRIQPDFCLFETIHVAQQQAKLWHLHRQRLLNSAKDLNFNLSEQTLDTAWLEFLSQLDHQAYRVKISLQPNNQLIIQHYPLLPIAKDIQYVALADIALQNHDLLRRYKTDYRHTFDHAWQSAEQQNAFDALFFNYDGYLLEGGRSNVFVRFGHEWRTPHLDLDILNGVMRQEIISNPQPYLAVDKVIETYINKEELMQADEIRLSNALRGVFPLILKI